MPLNLDHNDGHSFRGVLSTATSPEGDGEGDESESPTPDEELDSPVYPRTAAKLLRMRQRLMQQGFASFIE